MYMFRFVPQHATFSILLGETKQKGFEDYFFALERDFQDHSKDRQFSTVFVGGGTPGLLSAEQIGKLCQLINRAGVRKL